MTARTVATATGPARLGDGGGLWLQVTGGGGKSWLFRYMLRGRARWMGLGPVDLVSLAEARERAREARKQLLAGVDPIEAREAAKSRVRLDAARTLTFRQCAEAYVAAHRESWRNEKHRAQWTSTLETYCYPALGDLPVADVDTTLVMQVLEPIWSEKPETAGRVRGRVEAVLDWATVREYRAGENPARWRGHLDKLLPARSRIRRVRHHAAMPYQDVPGFMRALRDQDGVGARALEFTILTAARTGETIGATWDEIDLAAKLWTVPAARMKAGRDHRVPLTDRAVALLSALPREKDNPHVFIGARARRPMSNMTMTAVLRRLDRGDVTVHGFRSAFRDWSAETTAYPREVCEQALAHTLSDKVEAAYRRGDLFAKRRRLMEDWLAFCRSAPRPAATVVPIREAGR